MSSREGLPNLTRDEVLARLSDALGGDASGYAPLLQPSIWLRVDEGTEPDLLGSRFGGPAMMPEGFEWPMYTSEPYMGRDPAETETFTLWYARQQQLPTWLIAQINLAELPIETPLPRQGLLSVFYDPFDGPTGDSKSDQHAVRMIYIPPEQFPDLRRFDRPEPAIHPGAFADWRWPHHRMEFYLKWSFSNWEAARRVHEPVADAWPWRDVEERVSETMQEVFGYSFGHFLLDGGVNHQSDPRESAEHTWNPDPELPDGLPDEDYLVQMQTFERRARKNWTCLLSITKDSVLNPVVGDTGGLSFLIRKADLAQRRFDRPWVVRS